MTWLQDGAIIASFENGLASDEKWRCTASDDPDADFPGYKTHEFDDSDWDPALVSKGNKKIDKIKKEKGKEEEKEEKEKEEKEEEAEEEEEQKEEEEE